jgi:hypothetical protein
MMRRHKTNLRIGTKAHVDTVNNGDTVNHLPAGAKFFPSTLVYLLCIILYLR